MDGQPTNLGFSASIDISPVEKGMDELVRAIKRAEDASDKSLKDLSKSVNSSMLGVLKTFVGVMDPFLAQVKKAQAPATKEAQKVGQAVANGVAKGIEASAGLVGKAYSEGVSSGLRKAAPAIQRELAGHYDALGVFISTEAAKLEAVAKKHTAGALLLDTGEVRQSTKQAQNQIAGHYNALGTFVSVEAAKLERSAKDSSARALMLDTGAVRQSTKQAQNQIAGHYNALGMYISAEAARVAAKAEADNARLADAIAKSGRLATLPDTGRSLQAPRTTSNGLWQAGLAKEASGIRAETIKFYSQMEADAKRMEAMWGRLGSASTVSDSFRSLQGTLRKETDEVVGILRNGTSEVAAAQRSYYQELERVGKLKEAIRQRLDTSNVGVQRSAPARMTLDQKDAQYAEAMAAMRSDYQARQTPDVKPQKHLLSDLLGLTSAKREFKDAVDKANKSMADGSGVSRSFNKDLNGLHSAARGVASGFNAMWLTWGQLGPLLAGAALSNVFVQAIQKGSAFESTLTTISALGEQSSESIAAISKAALELGANSHYGPQQIAEGMKAMVLAGESAQDSIAGIGMAMQFATVSELPMEQATEYLMAITKSFGFATDQMNHVSDVVAKTAATTMSSVKDMADAFRVSSTVAQQFGATIQDQSVVLGMLSQIGIKGREAGTAVRNMYTELLGTSKKARAILEKEFKLKLFDDKDQLRPLKEVMVDMAKTVGEFDAKGQLSVLNEVFNERGMKAASAYLHALDSQARSLGIPIAELVKNTSELEKALANASGFSAVASAAMEATTQNIMKSVSSSLDASLIKAFEAVSPYLIQFSLELRNAIQSEEFVNGISDIVRSIGDFSRMLYENLDLIKAVGAGYLTYKVMSIGLLAPLTLLTLGTKSSTVALAEKAVAMSAAGGASALAAPAFGLAARAITAVGIAGRVALGLLGPITLLLTAGVAAYTLFGDSAQSAADKAAAAAEEQAQRATEAAKSEELRLGVSMEAMDKEIERIKVFLKNGGDEKKTQEELATLAIDTARTRIASEAEVRAQLAETRAEELELTAAVEERRSVSSGGLGPFIQELRDQASAARLAAGEIRNNAAVQAIAFEARVNELKTLRAEEDKFKAKPKGPNAPKGPRTFDPDSGSGRKGAKDRIKQLKLDASDELAQIEKAYRDNMSLVQKQLQNEKQINQAHLDAKLISTGEHYAKELTMTAVGEAKQLELNRKAAADALRVRDADVASLQAQYATWEAVNKGKANAQDKLGEKSKDLADKIKGVNDKYTSFVEGVKNSDKEIKDNALTRITLAAIKAKGELKALELASKEFWRSEALNAQKTQRADKVEDRVRYATPEQSAVIQAGAAEWERLNDKMEDQKNLLKEAEKARDDYVDGIKLLDAALKDVTMSEEQRAQINKAAMDGEIERTDVVKALQAELDRLATGQSSAVSAAETRALDRFRKDEVRDLSFGVADALATGLEKGSKEGAKSMRSLLEAKLREKFVISVAASLGDFLGPLMGVAGGKGGAAGGGGIAGTLQTASNVNSSWGAASQAMFGGTAGASMASLGYANAVGAVGGDALGALIAGNGGWAGVAGATASEAIALNIAAEAGTAVALEAGTIAAAAAEGAVAGTAATGAAGAGGSSLLASIPGWGWAASAALMFAGSGLFKSPGEQHRGGMFSTAGDTSMDTAMRITGGVGGRARDLTTRKDEGITKTLRLATDDLMNAGDAINQLTGKQERTFDLTLGFASNLNGKGKNPNNFGYYDIIDKTTGEVLKSYQNRELGKDPGQAMNKMGADVVRSMLDLAKNDMPQWAQAVFDSLSEDLSVEELVGQVEQVSALKSNTQAMAKLGVTGFQGEGSDATVSAMIKDVGGVKQLNTLFSGYYNEFVSAGDKFNYVLGEAGDKFKEIGVEMPKSGEGLKNWYNAQVQTAMGADLSTQANRDQLASLLRLAPTVNATTAAWEEAKQAKQEELDLTKVDTDLRNQMLLAKGLITQREIDLQAQLATATSAAQAALMRMTSAVVAAADLWSSISSEINSQNMEDAGTEGDKAAEELQRRLETASKSIQDFIKDITTGTEDELKNSRLSHLRAQARYEEDLAKAKTGDVDAMERVTSTAKNYLQSQVDRAGSAVDVRRAKAQMAYEMSQIPKFDGGDSKGKDKDKDKPKTPIELYEEALKNWTLAMKDLLIAIQETEMDPETYEKFVDAADAISDAMEAIKTSGIPLTLKTDATNFLTDLARIMEVGVKATWLDEDIKQLVAGAGTVLARAVEVTVTSQHSDATIKLALSTLEPLKRTLDFLVNAKDIDPVVRKLALANNGMLSTTHILAMSTQGMSKDDIRLVMNYISETDKLINIIVNAKDIPNELKEVVLGTTLPAIDKMVRLGITDFKGEDKQMLFSLETPLRKLVELTATSKDIPDDLKRVVLEDTIPSITRTVVLAAKDFSDSDRDLIKTAEDKIIKDIELAVSEGDVNTLSTLTAKQTALEVIVSASNGVLTPEVQTMLDEGNHVKMVDMALQMKADQFNIDMEGISSAREVLMDAKLTGTEGVDLALTAYESGRAVPLAALLQPGNTVNEIAELAANRNVFINAMLEAGTAPDDIARLTAATNLEIKAVVDVGEAADLKAGLTAPDQTVIKAILNNTDAVSAKDLLTQAGVVPLEAKLETGDATTAKNTLLESATALLDADLETTGALKDKQAVTDPATAQIKAEMDTTDADRARDALADPITATLTIGVDSSGADSARDALSEPISAMLTVTADPSGADSARDALDDPITAILMVEASTDGAYAALGGLTSTPWTTYVNVVYNDPGPPASPVYVSVQYLDSGPPAPAQMLQPLATGTNYVPQDMPAYIHKGERIMPAADNAALMEALEALRQGGTQPGAPAGAPALAALPNTLSLVQQGLSAAISGGSKVLGGSVDDAQAGMSASMLTMQSVLSGAVGAWREQSADSASSLQTGLTDSVSTLQGALDTSTNTLGTRLTTSVATMQTGLSTSLTGMQTSLGAAVANMQTGLGTALNTMRTGLGTAVVTMQTGLGTVVTNTGTGLSGVMTTMRTGLGGSVSDMRTGLGGSVSDMRTGLGGSVSDMRTGLNTTVGNLQTSLATNVNTLGTNLTNKVGYLQTALTTAIGSLTAAVNNVKLGGGTTTTGGGGTVPGVTGPGTVKPVGPGTNPVQPPVPGLGGGQTATEQANNKLYSDIARAYQMMLGRKADATEKENWFEELRKNKITDATTIALKIAQAGQSAGEIQDGVLKTNIASSFKEILKKDISVEDMSYWTDKLQGGEFSQSGNNVFNAIRTAAVSAGKVHSTDVAARNFDVTKDQDELTQIINDVFQRVGGQDFAASQDVTSLWRQMGGQTEEEKAALASGSGNPVEWSVAPGNGSNMDMATLERSARDILLSQGKLASSDGLEFDYMGRNVGVATKLVFKEVFGFNPGAKQLEEMHKSVFGYAYLPQKNLAEFRAEMQQLHAKATAKGDEVYSHDGTGKNPVYYKQWLTPFAVGTNYVPGDMPAYIHEGERIIPAADNAELMAALATLKAMGLLSASTAGTTAAAVQATDLSRTANVLARAVEQLGNSMYNQPVMDLLMETRDHLDRIHKTLLNLLDLTFVAAVNSQVLLESLEVSQQDVVGAVEDTNYLLEFVEWNTRSANETIKLVQGAVNLVDWRLQYTNTLLYETYGKVFESEAHLAYLSEVLYNSNTLTNSIDWYVRYLNTTVTAIQTQLATMSTALTSANNYLAGLYGKPTLTESSLATTNSYLASVVNNTRNAELNLQGTNFMLATTNSYLASVVNNTRNAELNLQGTNFKLADISSQTRGAEMSLSWTNTLLTNILQATKDGNRASKVPGYATGGYHTGGLRIVGENGPELEATGPSRIWTANQTRRMLSGEQAPQVSDARLEALVMNLIHEVKGLRAETQATAGHAAKTSKVLTRVTNNGEGMVVAPA